MKFNSLKIMLPLALGLFVIVPSCFAAETLYFIYDSPCRSVTALVNASQAAVNAYAYTAFGNVASQNESNANVCKYNGEQNEQETSLIFLRNRYYDPSVGRFITKDIVSGVVKNPQTINPYTYVNNNPLTYIDPLGLYSFKQFLGDLDAYSKVTAAACFFAGPEAWSGVVVFGGISAAASGLKYTLYSNNPILDTIKEGVKAIVGIPLGSGYSYFSDQAIDAGFDSFSSNRNNQNGGPPGGPPGGGPPSGGGLGGGSGGLGGGSGFNNSNLIDLGSNIYADPAIFETPVFGGVSLSKTATLLLNVQDVGGATFDQATGQVILYGKRNVALPNMSLDDLAVAVSSEYGLHKPAQDPGVSIGTEPSDVPGQMKVRYDGDTLNTNFGSVMFNSDRLLKTLTLGQDNITGSPVSATVPGYQNMLDRYKAAQYLPPNGSSTRMWFTPKEITLAQSADGSAMEFSQATMELLTESKYLNNVTGDPYAEAFAAQVTQNYDAYASEFPILQQLTRLGKITAVVKWIKDNNIPFDLSFFSNYVPMAGTTPQYTPQTSVTTSWTNGSTIYSLTITGGVIYKLDASNFASSTNPVATTASQAAISTRPSDTDFSWNFSAQDPSGNTDQFTAIAQSFTRSQKDGSVRGSKVDVSFPVAGDNPLALVRYYNSFYDKSTGFGYGWQITPFSIRFPAGPQSFTFGNNAFTVNANYQIYVREGQNEYLYTLSGLNVNDKPVYMREGGSYILTDNQDGTLTLNCLNIGKANFNNSGLLTSVTDRNGIAINYAYNGSNLISITHQNGRAITLNYTGNVITSAIGPASRTVNYTYYPNGQLNTVVDAANQTTTYVYDNDLHITQIIDPRRNTSYQAVYDDYNRAISQTAGSAQYSSDFDLTDSMTTTTDPNNATTTQYFDENYHLAQSVDFLNNTTNIIYDPDDFGPSTVTDANGQVTNYLYDSSGNVWYMKDAKGGQKFFFYDTNKNLVAARNELGNDTVYVYDANNRLTEARTLVVLDWTTPATPTLPPSSISYSYDPNYVTKYTYDSNGNLRSVTDEMSRVVNTTYDANGMPLTVTAPSGYQTIKTYDSLSRLSTVSDPGGDATSFYYDNVDRITKIITIAGNVNYTYDANGNLAAVTDGNNNMTTYSYDSNNNLITVTDAATGVTHYTYDITNKLTKITMPNGAVKDLTYDEANRPVMEISEKTDPAPFIAITPASIDFGPTPAGTQVMKQLIIYNVGDDALSITEVSVDNNSFTVSPASATIPAGGQFAFNLTFTAPASGGATGNLTIQCNDRANPTMTVSLSGLQGLPTLHTSASLAINGINISWDKYAGSGSFNNYKIYRSNTRITDISGLNPIQTITNIASVISADGTILRNTDYYYCVIAFDANSNGLNSISSSGPVRFTGLDTQVVSVSPASLNFGTSLTTQTITLTGVQGSQSYNDYKILSGTNVSDQPWLSATPASFYTVVGTPPPIVTVTVKVNRSGMAAGAYSGNINVFVKGTLTIVPVTMTVPNLPPNSPTNPTPVTGATGQALLGKPLRVALAWQCSDPQGDVLTYDIYLSDNQSLVTNANSSVLIAQNQASASYVSSALSYNKTYYWRVKAKDSGGLSALGNVWSFTTIPISAPVLLPPTPNPTNTIRPVFRWNAVDGAALYHIQIANNPNFNSPILNSANIAATEYTPSVDLPEGTIYWRVSAIDAQGSEGAFSSSDNNSIVIDVTPPPQVSLIPYAPDPTNNQKPVLTWNASPGASLYHVQIAGTNDFSTPLFDEYVSVANYTPVSNLPEGKIWWRVSAKDLANNESPYSLPGSFTIDITPPGVVHITSAEGGLGNIKITWDAFNDVGGDFHNFNIYRAESTITNVSGMIPVNQSITDKTVTSFVDTTAATGKAYYYVVTAIDTASNEYKQVTSFGPVNSISYGYVSGTVIDEIALLPVENVWMRAYDWNTNGLIDSTQTLSDGTYRFGNLPPGSYRIYADTAGTGYGHEYYNNVESQSSAVEVIVTSGATTQGINFVLPVLEEVSTDIHAAFNQICFSVMPQDLPSPYKASQLTQDMALQGITIDIVMQWDPGIWKPYQAGLPFTDFALNLDNGIFIDVVSNEWNAGTWTLKGKKIKLPKAVNLYEGWNLVSIPTTMTATSVIQALQQINSQGGAADVMMCWDGGWWISTQVNLPFTNQELVKTGRSYFVRCNSDSQWEQQ